MDFNNDSFNDFSSLNRINNNLFRTDDRLGQFNNTVNNGLQARHDMDRDYGLMHIAPKMPMPM